MPGLTQPFSLPGQATCGWSTPQPHRLQDCKYGLYVYAGALASGATVVLHGNDLSGNSSAGVHNADPSLPLSRF